MSIRIGRRDFRFPPDLRCRLHRSSGHWLLLENAIHPCRQRIRVVRAQRVCRIDTLDEVTYVNNGGILQTVLRDLAA